jgi:hypothetical protein
MPTIIGGRKCSRAASRFGIHSVKWPLEPNEDPQAFNHDHRPGLVAPLSGEEWRRALIDRAAKVAGKSRSEFMLDAAYHEATSVLLDRRQFLLDAKTFKR